MLLLLVSFLVNIQIGKAGIGILAVNGNIVILKK